MKTLFTILILILFILFSCNTKAVVKTDSNADKIQKEKAHLSQVKFTKAIKIYGEPYISNKKKIEVKNLSIQQLAAVKPYFPNKEYESTKVFFLEAQWKRTDNNKLIVWYLFIENEWKPIEVHAKL